MKVTGVCGPLEWELEAGSFLRFWGTSYEHAFAGYTMVRVRDWLID